MPLFFITFASNTLKKSLTKRDTDENKAKYSIYKLILHSF